MTASWATDIAFAGTEANPVIGYIMYTVLPKPASVLGLPNRQESFLELMNPSVSPEFILRIIHPLSPEHLLHQSFPQYNPSSPWPAGYAQEKPNDPGDVAMAKDVCPD